MLNVITFKGEKNREKFVAISEMLRERQIFHNAKLLDNLSVIWYNDNIRGLESLKEE